MLTFDGRQGEGGGQILRTCLSLATVFGRPFRLEHIRAGRSKPGLKPQHLTCVRAAAAICGAVVHGDQLHSQTLEFHPQQRPQGGRYRFDVAEEAGQGSAGSTSLIVQTILWPLLFADAPSQVTLRGGTHVNHSPTFHYLQNVAFPQFRPFGVNAHLTLHEWGWYPHGGGQIQLEVIPNQTLRGVERPLQPTTTIHGLSIATNLPGHIPHRMARRADNLLEEAGYALQIDTRRQKSHSEGAGIFLWSDTYLAGGTGLGRPGYASQHVAEDAVRELLAAAPADGRVGSHLVDQLLLPMALARGRSSMMVTSWSSHAATNAAVIEKWLDVNINHHEGLVSITN